MIKRIITVWVAYKIIAKGFEYDADIRTFSTELKAKDFINCCPGWKIKEFTWEED